MSAAPEDQDLAAAWARLAGSLDVTRMSVARAATVCHDETRRTRLRRVLLLLDQADGVLASALSPPPPRAA